MRTALKKTDFLLFLMCFLVFFRYLSTVDGGFGDFRIYKRAIFDHLHGESAYRTDVQQHLFIYNPIVLHFLAFIESFLSITVFLGGFYLLTSLGFYAEIYKCFQLLHTKNTQPDRNKSLDFIVIFVSALAFGDIGIGCFVTGNLTLYLHFALIAVLLKFCRTGFPVYSYAFIGLVIVFSVIKPYFLTYMAVLFLIYKSKKNSLITAFIMIALFSIAWIASMQFFPEEYQAFLAALNKQTLTGHDIGYSFFAVFKKAGMSDLLSLAIHALISVLLLIIAGLYLPKAYGFVDNLYARLFILYPVLTLINPRMKEYDLYPALICFLIFLYQVTEKDKRIMLAGLLVSLVPVISSAVNDAGINLPMFLLQNHTWQLLGLGTMAMALAGYEFSRKKLAEH